MSLKFVCGYKCGQNLQSEFHMTGVREISNIQEERGYYEYRNRNNCQKPEV